LVKPPNHCQAMGFSFRFLLSLADLTEPDDGQPVVRRPDPLSNLRETPDGRPLAEIGARYEVMLATASQWIPTRRRVSRPARVARGVIDRATLAERYQAGLTLAKVAAQLACPRGRWNATLVAFGVPRHQPGPRSSFVLIVGTNRRAGRRTHLGDPRHELVVIAAAAARRCLLTTPAFEDAAPSRAPDSVSDLPRAH